MRTHVERHSPPWPARFIADTRPCHRPRHGSIGACSAARPNREPVDTDAPHPLFPSHPQGNPERGGDRLAPAHALAVAIGTSHGAYKFTRKPTGEILAISRIEEIHRRLPNTHLVMHGSSSVPEDLIALINKYGGAIPETYGVPVEEIQKGIKSGVRKVNIDTDNRLAITAAVREALAANPKEFDPRHFLKPSIKYMQKVCADRYVQFGTAGNASKIKQVSLEDYAAKYAKGELVMRAAAKV